MDAGALRFEVQRTRFSVGALLRDGWLGKTSVSGSYEDPVKGPSIVVHNATGEKRTIEVARTVKAAEARAAAIEQDFTSLDPSTWCERYGVPLSFVTG